jgi:hypothetical protein
MSSNNGIVDLRATIREQEKMLAKYDESISEIQAKMRELTASITETENKKAEVRNIIAVCRKLLGESGIPGITATTAQYLETVRKRHGLPKAISSLLDSEPNEDFPVGKVSDRLIEQGFPTRSQNFKSVIRNTLARMASDGSINVKEDGQNKIYWSKLRDREGGLLEIAENKAGE